MTKLTELKRIEKAQDKEKLYEFAKEIANFNVGHGCCGSALMYLFNCWGSVAGVVLLFKLGYISALQDNNLLSKDAEPKEKGRVIFRVISKGERK